MAIGIRVGSIITEVGSSEFFHAFFSTVSGLLEPDGWGSRFPKLMNEFYQGSLTPDQCSAAALEIRTVQNELRKFKPDQVIWDIENRELQPPWGSNISSDITDLSNYFITSTGRDLIQEIIENIEHARDIKALVTVE